jgi:transposase-like protein
LIFALILRHVRRSRISPRDESLNARFRKVIDARGHFPNEQPAMKALYPAVPSLDPKGTGQQRWITRWKPILNVLAVSYPKPRGSSGDCL